MLRYIPMFVLIALSLFGYAGCMMEGASDQDLASEEEQLESSTQELADHPAALAALKWQLFTAESCRDLCGPNSNGCSCRSFTPGCPANPQGKACSTRNARCWTVNSSQAKLYLCK